MLSKIIAIPSRNKLATTLKTVKAVTTLLRERSSSVRFKTDPFDIATMVLLIRKAEEAVAKIAGKNIILLLGATGVGKSTTIHFLAGSKMAKQKMHGLDHIGPLEITNEALAKVKTDPRACSTTRYITAVPVSYTDPLRKQQQIVLCDTPGFEDTSGPEVDVANSVGIIKAVRTCRSVKPVILISSRSMGDRMQGVKALAHVLANMVDIQDQVSSFSYIFTKFSATEAQDIHARLNSAYEEMSADERLEESFRMLLEDMVQKTKEKVVLLDPLQHNPIELLETLRKRPSIRHPAEAFWISFPERATSALQEQVYLHRDEILEAIKQKKYNLVLQKMDELKILMNELDSEAIEEIYHRCVQSLVTDFQEIRLKETELMKRCLEDQNSLTIEDVQAYQHQMQQLFTAHSLLAKHLEGEEFVDDSFSQNLQDSMQSLLQNLRARSITENQLITVRLDKMQLLAQSFLEVQPIYQEACNVVNGWVQALHTDVKAFIIANEFAKTGQGLDIILLTATTVERHLEQQVKLATYKGIQDQLQQHLEQLAVVPHLDQARILDEKELSQLKQQAVFLEAAKEEVSLRTHLPKEKIVSFLNTFLLSIERYFSKIIARINETFARDKEKSFPLLEKEMLFIAQLRQVPGVEARTAEIYYRTWEILNSAVQQVRRETENMVHLFLQDKQALVYQHLDSRLQALQNATWIDALQKSTVVSQALTEAYQGIIVQSKKNLDAICQAVVEPSRFPELTGRLTKMEVLVPLEARIPALTEHRTAALTAVQETFTLKIIELTSFYKSTPMPERLDFLQLEENLVFLQISQNIPIVELHTQAATGLKYLGAYLAKYSHSLNQAMRSDLVDKKDVRTIRRLTSRFAELAAIQEFYPSVYALFPVVKGKDPIAQAQKLLLEDAQELANQLEALSTQQCLHELATTLQLTRFSCQLDEFLTSTVYRRIHEKYTQIYKTGLESTRQRLRVLAEKKDYASIVTSLEDLSQLEDTTGRQCYKAVRDQMCLSLTQLTKETATICALKRNRELSVEVMRPVVANLEHLTGALTYLSGERRGGFLSLPQQRTLKEALEEGKQLCSVRLTRYLDTVAAVIGVFDFDVAEDQLETVGQIYECLGQFCLPCLQDKLQSVQALLDETLHVKIKREYIDIDFSTYYVKSISLKDVWHKLQRVMARDLKYQKAWEQLETLILAKFRAEIAILQHLDGPDRGVRLHVFSAALSRLPDLLKEALTGEVYHALGALSDQEPSSLDLHREQPLVPKELQLDLNTIARIQRGLNQNMSVYEIASYEDLPLQTIQYYLRHGLLSSAGARCAVM